MYNFQEDSGLGSFASDVWPLECKRMDLSCLCGYRSKRMTLPCLCVYRSLVSGNLLQQQQENVGAVFLERGLQGKKTHRRE